MSNSVFPELDGWDEINSSPGTIGTGINKAIHRLVISLTNLRSATSAKLGYLNNKVERLQGSIDKLNQCFVQLNKNIEKADESSTKLSTALNRLTSWGVSIAGVSVIVVLLQFLYENHIWP